MNTLGTGAAISPVAVLLSTAALDDAGAETADRYEWQAMMATVDVLAAYAQRLGDAGILTDADAFTVICELHEDWAIVTGDVAELVSAKHREPSVARLTTLKSLLDCGVFHLYERWRALGRTPLCRLVTTAGLADDAAKMHAACDALRQPPDPLPDGLHQLVVRCGAQIAVLREDGLTPDVEELVAFFGVLRIQCGEARREHLPDMAPRRFAKPIAERLGRPEAAEAIWSAVLVLVRERMRAAGPASGGSLPIVLGVPVNDDPHAGRSLRLSDVDVAVRVALRNVAGYARLPRLIRVNKMAAKLSRGGCSDNTIERLDSLRLQHRAHWRGVRGTPTVRDRRLRIDNAVMKVVAEVTEAVRTSDADWGILLLDGVESRLQSVAGLPEVQGFDADLLLGAVADLSNDCKVWFSDRFDIQAEIARLRAAS